MTTTRTEYRDRRRPQTARNVPRQYPGADANTAQLVNKLRNRGATNPQTMRQTSSALIEDAYRGAVESGQTPRQFDNNYSPYSNVNAGAAEETMRRQEEARRRAEAKRIEAKKAASMRQNPGRSVDAGRKAPAQNRSMTKREKPAAPVSKSERKRRADIGQLADSGPREVAVKHVPFPKFAFLIIFMCVVLFFMVQALVHNYEQQRQIAELQKKADVLAQYAELLRSDLEARDDLAEIEERAEDIGMVKGSQVDEKYIDLSGGDVIENFGGSGEEDMGSFTTMLSAIRRRLSRFLD